MGTRSTIALEFADDTVQQIYCHWDGYLDNNGKLLYQHYQDPFLVRDLIDLGGFSSLRDTVAETAETAYVKTHGEDLRIGKFKDFEDYVESHQYEEYEYILRRDGHWYVSDHGRAYVMLSDAIVDQMLQKAMEQEALAD